MIKKSAPGPIKKEIHYKQLYVYIQTQLISEHFIHNAQNAFHFYLLS